MRITNDLVPHYAKENFDSVATEFLTAYYPKALASPMPVPIRDVVTKKLGLRILERHLTEDLSVYGQMCFTSGVAEIYDRENEEYKEIKVRWGTMIIDPDTLSQRNIGCLNNTITHEGVHWWKHRDYHILQTVLDKRAAKVYKCPTTEPDESKQGEWTDEMWMEWHAVNIAPRILMPVQTFGDMFEYYKTESQRSSIVLRGAIPSHKWIVTQLSEFYVVSKQSVEKRLSELGCLSIQ
ncbi:hypothetical protein LQZ18_02985 [Lachnospiraceae bacterium ZAX-1]